MTTFSLQGVLETIAKNITVFDSSEGEKNTRRGVELC